MSDSQTVQTRIDELNRCMDRSWLSVEDEKRFGIGNQTNLGRYQDELVDITPKAPTTGFKGLIGIGKKVFLPGDHLIGLTTKLFLTQTGQISHLAVRTARLFGQHKMVPISSVSKVVSGHIQLSLTREQFMELPNFQDDAAIREEADRALWKDVVLRETDYREIDVQVRDGFVTLNGHVITSMNQWRAENAVKHIPGILGMKSYLIPDDKLTLIVAEAIGKVEQEGNSKIFAKVENGLAVLVGEVSSIAQRDQAEKNVAEIPWVRGVINEIQVPGIGDDSQEQGFLQPLIGNELLFKDSISVTIRKVIINRHNRRVEAVVVLGRFPDPKHQGQKVDYRGERNPEQLMVLPVGLILYLTSRTGFVRINSDEVTEYKAFHPSRYTTPDRDWLPPYPYCTDEVLFLTA